MIVEKRENSVLISICAGCVLLLGCGEVFAGTAKAKHGMAPVVAAGGPGAVVDLKAHSRAGGMVNVVTNDTGIPGPAAPLVGSNITFPNWFWGARAYAPVVGVLGAPKPGAAGIRTVSSITDPAPVFAPPWAQAAAIISVPVGGGPAALLANASRSGLGGVLAGVREAAAEAVDPLTIPSGTYLDYKVEISQVELTAEYDPAAPVALEELGLRFFGLSVPTGSTQTPDIIWEVQMGVIGEFALAPSDLLLTVTVDDTVFPDANPSQIMDDLEAAIAFDAFNRTFTLSTFHLPFGDFHVSEANGIDYWQGLSAFVVPEPTTMCLLALGVLALRRQRFV